ncbi:hypothetical protein OHV66_18205 [Acinetobacter baumannii]|uniref:Uncharacterized protein n=1 Tax=Acinetobacter baumannii TaxID=470 RepID=A0AAP1W5W8_ACIBA|nr:hypothetical protein [Acinetobacter baumannii]EXA62229.1 hypothetical protein J521_1067 [Acinetobacter baumannii 1035119]MBD2848961.1 hypothetical protein [Acinetobacter baumannii]MBD3134241.1 hypothetical protein [Acinetobacter baumannii]MBE0305795.1 hypothetical protein [Acinetobacter baumannii]MBE0313125.1 hypothetical protein [Acinetobacter baumannii]
MEEFRVKVKDESGIELYVNAYIYKWIAQKISAPLKRLNYIEYIVIGDERILPNERYLFFSVLTGKTYKVDLM